MMNQEQKDFVYKIAKRLSLSIVAIQDDISIFVENEGEYLYEEFVGEFCDPDKDSEVGMLAVVNNVPKVLVPYKEGNIWLSINAMKHQDNHPGIGVSYSGYTIDKLYGLTNLNNGYCSPYGRVKLYDSSWKKVELTIEQIAEKFGVNPEQIRIKK